MKRLLVIALAAVSISACAENGRGIDVMKVQQMAVSICKYEPTAQTVVNIFSSGSPMFATAAQIASAICNAVNSPRSAGEVPKVNGVPVRGKRV